VRLVGIPVLQAELFKLPSVKILRSAPSPKGPTDEQEAHSR
jgi:hypothetical protein